MATIGSDGSEIEEGFAIPHLLHFGRVRGEGEANGNLHAIIKACGQCV